MNRELTIEETAINFVTYQHIYEVQKLILKASQLLQKRMLTHDQSKLSDPEVSLFTVMTPKLKTAEYGNAEYNQFLADLKPALDNHYASNSHHPQHYKDGIDGMNLIDILEMLCDWLASISRGKDGNIDKSFEINEKRFNMSPQLVNIMKNTVPLLVRKKSEC
jgi:hypothetical protein